MHPRSRHWYLPDYVLVRRRNQPDMTVIKSTARPDEWTDHRLDISKMSIRQKPSRRPQGKRPPGKLNTDLLSSPAQHPHFSNKPAKSLVEIPDTAASAEENASVENRRCQVRDTVQSMVLAVLVRVRRQHQDWFDENDAVFRNLLIEKNRLYKAYVNRLTDDSKAVFCRSRSLVQQRLREMLDAWTTRNAETVYSPTLRGIARLLSTDGTTLLNELTKILQRWAKHFRGVLNLRSTISDAGIGRLPEVVAEADPVLPPSPHKTIKAAKQLSGEKTLGADAIPAEIYKHREPQIMGHLKTLFQEMRRRGEVPQHFKNATVVHLSRHLNEGMTAHATDSVAVSETFLASNGVKQGRLLLPALFSLMLSATLMDVYRDECPEIRFAYRTVRQLLNQRRIPLRSHISTTTPTNFYYPTTAHSAPPRVVSKREEAAVMHQPPSKPGHNTLKIIMKRAQLHPCSQRHDRR
nr:unnamed protein product [Spirometra erinaceieuropaei]